MLLYVSLPVFLAGGHYGNTWSSAWEHQPLNVRGSCGEAVQLSETRTTQTTNSVLPSEAASPTRLEHTKSQNAVKANLYNHHLLFLVAIELLTVVFLQLSHLWHGACSVLYASAMTHFGLFFLFLLHKGTHK